MPFLRPIVDTLLADQFESGTELTPLASGWLGVVAMHMALGAWPQARVVMLMPAIACEKSSLARLAKPLVVDHPYAIGIGKDIER